MDVIPKEELRKEIESERSAIVTLLENWLEIPMLVLSIIWLALFVVEMTIGISPFLETIGNVIWIIFGIDFGVKFLLAPKKLE